MSDAPREIIDGGHSAGLSIRSMLKELFGLGCIGFGGGSALIPVFKERLVDTGKVDEGEFESAVAVACITPGALPVELASGIGLRTHGAIGALAAAAAFALPGVALMLFAMAMLAQSDDALLEQVSFLAVGVSGYIASVIMRYVAGTASRSSSSRGRALSCALIAVVFALTCGKALFRLIGADMRPPICLGTVDVMGLAFFSAIWIGPKRTPARIASAVVVVALYCLLDSAPCGTGSSVGPLKLAVIAAMVVMAVTSLVRERQSAAIANHTEQTKDLLKALGVFAVALVAALIAASLASERGLPFAVNGMLSSILSFGGGDAYIAMADGLFADSGIVSQDDFYGIVVPVSNALPGSILCKVLAGCGFSAGMETPGSMAAALVLGISGFAIAVAMSCATFAAGSFLLASLKGSAAFGALERSVSCVVSGLLLTVLLGLLQLSVDAAPSATPPMLAIMLPVVVAVLNLYAKQRFNLPALAAVVLSAATSALVLNLV